MKVLFAVNNENISESIIKKYQQEYKEIISVKNVYYFNAIIKELQRDKTYDRIVVSEDLQPFSNNNYEQIDKFIFEKMDNISDEATNQSGNDIPIILICTDRREKSEPLLIKLFGIGVYNALIGKDRSITNVCELLARPRSKKEAKIYYRIDSEDVDYKVGNEGDVSEVEIQNIVNHYKKLGGNEEKYVESFEHIASQYTDSQLRLIANFLPLNVKAVLEANSMKYQEIVSFGGAPKHKEKVNKVQANNNYAAKPIKQKEEPKKEDVKLDVIEQNLNKNKMTEPVIIPNTINTGNVKRMQEMPEQNIQSQKENIKPQAPVKVVPEQIQEIDDILDSLQTQENEIAPTMPGIIQEEPQIEMPETIANVTKQEPNNIPVQMQEEVLAAEPVQPKRRGRPKKVLTAEEIAKQEEKQRRGRGRPKKAEPTEEMQTQASQEETIAAPINLFEMVEEEAPVTATNQAQASSGDDMFLPGIDDDDLFAEQVVDQRMPSMSKTEPVEEVQTGYSVEPVEDTFEVENENSIDNTFSNPMGIANETMYQMPTVENNPYETRQIENASPLQEASISNLLTRDKKIVAFLGTSKNGTSFLVNNIAELLSQKGINTAILDLTQNKNAYYIYTENEENLRKTAYECIGDLRRGNINGIQVHKNLTVYTTLPGEEEDFEDYSHILETLVQNYSLVILDCDFKTKYEYFKEIQELYLVQTLDVLTIQPLTAFLRNLKAKGVLDPEKIRIVLNKVVKLRSISDKTIIGGMAFYNDPAMSFMTELFNKDIVTYCSIPFEEQTYSKYLEGLINCKITLNGYSKNFMAILNHLGDTVYPLINNNPKMKNVNYNNYSANNNFSNDMNNTLNKMKNNYE
ncbi:MAG: hypothetical protein HFJ28_00980 [Clostridia bacterium]|nr:hypothetical protein [Clostridia bacterium]